MASLVNLKKEPDFEIIEEETETYYKGCDGPYPG